MDYNPDENVNVYWSTDQNKVLSNLAPRRFVYGGDVFHSVEHAYQTLRSGRFAREVYEKYKHGGVKITGRRVRDPRYAELLMYCLIKKSFEQNGIARRKLLKTRGKRITHLQDTSKWRTLFPEMLMKIREELS